MSLLTKESQNRYNKIRLNRQRNAEMVECTKMIWTIDDLARYTSKGFIKDNPICQRNSVESGKNNPKSIAIIQAMYDESTIGSITLRNIEIREDYLELDESRNKAIRCVYGNRINLLKWLVYDGGHRIRAIKDFVNGEFAIQIEGEPKKYFEMTLEQQDYFNSIQVSIDEIRSTCVLARKFFKNVNKCTNLSPMDEIMSNESTFSGEYVRSLIKKYDEYYIKNGCKTIIEPLEIFKMNDKSLPIYFKNDIGNNKNNKLSEWVIASIIKTVRGGNCDVGVNDGGAIQRFIDKGEIELENGKIVNFNKKNAKKYDGQIREFWNSFLNFIKLFGVDIKRKDFPNVNNAVPSMKSYIPSKSEANFDILGLFHSVWFTKLSKIKNTSKPLLAIKDNKKFARNFTESIIKCLSMKDVIQWKFTKGEPDKFLYDAIHKNSKQLAKGDIVEWVGNQLLSQMDDGCFLQRQSDKDRCASPGLIQELLENQGNKCAIDGYLFMNDFQAGHNLPYNLGGDLISDGKMIRNVHNWAMSNSYTIDQYIELWNLIKDGDIEGAKIYKKAYDVTMRSTAGDTWKPLNIIKRIQKIQKDHPELV